MKLSCNVIEDLLPLYHDNVCSEESKALVDEHLEECENCRNLLSKIDSEVKKPQMSFDETKPLKAIRFAWERSKRKAFIKGSVIAGLICALLMAGYLGLTRWKCIPVSADLLEVTEVSELSDGRIIYHLNVKDDKELHFVKFTTNADGSFYLTPMRSVIEEKRTGKGGLFNDYFMVDIAESNAYQQKFGDGIVITSCYIGFQESGILIWEKGMELPKASDALEKMVLGKN